MELQTIGQISRMFNISTRTLRYYEQIGLIQPIKKENYAYRTYDCDAAIRLQQILILRKLRIPLKQIADILKSDDTALAILAFQQNLAEIEDEMNALSTIKGVIQLLLERLQLQNDALRLLDDESLLQIVDSLTASRINFKEDKTMEELSKASAKLERLTDKDVRIVYLPPATVASYQYEGEAPEWHVAKVIDQFVLAQNLTKIKPDLRHYGFNAPSPKDESGLHGYEMWVTIPEDMQVPTPLAKKYFAGGVYAAHMIPIGAFDEWALLSDWLEKSDRYEYNGNGSPDNMFDSLEEALNYVNRPSVHDAEGEKNLQLDLLIPIKEKQK
jgi:Predicted transcriptional regulators